MTAINLKWSDLSPPSPNGLNIVDEYNYTDGQGTLLYQVVRLHPKDFRQRRPNTSGGWQWGLGGVQRTLYNLPAVLAEAAAGGHVWIVEGEKDADRLNQINQTATTCSGGAGRFTLELAEHLKGAAQVTVIADNDNPGRDHAAEIVFAVKTVGGVPLVNAVSAKEGKDVTDHLDAGHQLGDLQPVAIDITEPPKDQTALGRSVIDWPEFWATDHTATAWLMEPLFAAGRGHAVYAEAKAGKSWVLLAASCALATGQPFLNRPKSEPQTVLYLDYEMTADDLSDRLEEFGYSSKDDLTHLHYALLPAIDDLDDRTGTGGDEVVDMATNIGAQLVVIDTTSRAVGGEENDANTYRNLYKQTLSRLKALGIAVVRLDHTGKDPDKGMRGSSAKAADVDIVIHLKKVDGGKEWRATHRRLGWYPETTQIDINENTDTGIVTFGTGPETWPEGTQECVTHLNTLQLPLNVTQRDAHAALVKADLTPRRKAIVSKAVKWRQQQQDNTDLEGLL